jgi:inorganic triphosphatase YgiF
LETELKYLAADDRILERLADLPGLGPARLGPARVTHERDRYLDTVDRRLAAQRWACRLRTRDAETIVSLKGPAAPAQPDDPAALHRRPEIEGPASEALDPRRWPASAARDELLALSAGAPLVEQLRLEQERRQRDVLLDGTRAGELSLDLVSVLVGERPIGQLHAAELELDATRAPDATSVRRLDRALRDLGGLEADPRSKLEHALAMLAAAV